MRRFSKAFTMIELVVVIVIIAILAAISFVSYGAISRNALETSMKTNLSNIGQRIEVDALKTGAYPATEDEVGAGDGIPENKGMTYQYMSTFDFYCLSATSTDGSLVFKISSTNKEVSAGGCSDVLNWKQVASGYVSTCGLTYDGEVYCWGYNGAGQVGIGAGVDYYFVPQKVLAGEMPSNSDVKQISVGYGTACAIASDDNVYCWGWNAEGEVGIGTYDSIVETPTRVAQGARPNYQAKYVSVGDGHVCVIGSNDYVYCWGDNARGGLGISTTTTTSAVPVKAARGERPSDSVKYLSSGKNSNCAIATNDKAYCWGYNGLGQLGNNSDVDSYSPVAVLQGEMTAAMTVKSVSVGRETSCAIDTSGRLFCWGRGDEGQLGNDEWSGSYVPVAVDIEQVSEVSSGEYAVCAITIEGRAKCWGFNSEGVLGTDTVRAYGYAGAPRTITNGAIPDGAKLSSLSMYYDHTCAVASNGKAYCWGSGWEGQLGSGRTQDDYEIYQPIEAARGDIPGGVSVKAVYGGDSRSCIWGSDNKLYCWAQQTYLPEEWSYGLPMPNVKQVAMSDEHICVIASDDNVYCWGYNNHGQLGDGTTEDFYDFRRILQGEMPAGAVKAISASNYQSCAIASDNMAYCWGNNGYVDNLTPKRVAQGAMPSQYVKAVSAGHYFMCVIAAANDNVYCMGEGDDGQLGNGTFNDSPTLVAVSQGARPSLTAKSLLADADTYHMCSIGSDDSLYCWGGNWDGQLGDGLLYSTDIPVKAQMPAGIIKDYDAFDYNTCAISYDDKLYCWGGNYAGSLGTGDVAGRSTPTAVLQGEMLSPGTVKKVGMGVSFTCAVSWNDKAYCWGYNYYGQLGVAQNSRFANAIPNLVTAPN